MIHIIYIYLIINSFSVGAYLADNFNDDKKLNKFLFSVILFLFGGIIVLLDFISPKILNTLEYLTFEIKFQYKILFTDYFDKIYLDDSYTELYDSREKKLKRTEELSQNASKQVKRHNRLIQKKYGRNSN